MKKPIIITFTIIVLIFSAFIIWWKLPVKINRHADIKFAEQIIEKIEKHRLSKGLPENNDWTCLKTFGFRDKIDFLEAEYSKIDDTTYELIYIEGFDGPYLMWNSSERIWKSGYPSISDKQN